MTMDGRPAATRAIWPDIEKLICAKLDSFSNPESAVEINSSVIPGPRVLVHGPIHPRQPPCPRFPVERYIDRSALGREHPENVCGYRREPTTESVVWMNSG